MDHHQLTILILLLDRKGGDIRSGFNGVPRENTAVPASRSASKEKEIKTEWNKKKKSLVLFSNQSLAHRILEVSPAKI
jgi:hypothetical protein